MALFASGLREVCVTVNSSKPCSGAPTATPPIRRWAQGGVVQTWPQDRSASLQALCQHSELYLVYCVSKKRVPFPSFLKGPLLFSGEGRMTQQLTCSDHYTV